MSQKKIIRWGTPKQIKLERGLGKEYVVKRGAGDKLIRKRDRVKGKKQRLDELKQARKNYAEAEAWIARNEARGAKDLLSQWDIKRRESTKKRLDAIYIACVNDGIITE